jgi:PAS domain S-box-containing protein
MSKKIEAFDRKEMLTLAMESMGVAVTIIDTDGVLLYFNPHAVEILDRKPEYVGEDVHSHHKKDVTNDKLDGMIKKFQEGRAEPFRYEAKPYGKALDVVVSPIIKGGVLVGCVQAVLPK